MIHFVLVIQSSFYFLAVTSTVRNTLQEACVQILAPKRRIDILRDAMDAKHNKLPYVITFCGVNGVGKSTNLAKVGIIVSFLSLRNQTWFYLGYFSVGLDMI